MPLAIMRVSERHIDDASDEAPAEERPQAACVAGERNEPPAWPGNAMQDHRTPTRTTLGRSWPVPWLPPAGGEVEATMCSMPYPVHTPQS